MGERHTSYLILLISSLYNNEHFSNFFAPFRFPSLPELSGWLDGCASPCPSHLPTLLHHQLLWLNQQQSPQTRFPTYNSQTVGEVVSLRVSAEQASPTRKMAVEVISGVFDPRNYRVSVFCLVFVYIGIWLGCMRTLFISTFIIRGGRSQLGKEKEKWVASVSWSKDQVSKDQCLETFFLSNP